MRTLFFALAVLAVTPPATPVRPVVETIHGVEVRDPYRWLEDGDNAEVQAWTSAQNAVTRKALDAVPGRAAIERRLWDMIEVGALGVPVVRGRGKAVRLFHTRRDGKQNQPVLYVREGLGGTDRPLVDVNVLASDGTAALDWWYPSEDGRFVAYGVSLGGDEKSTLRVRDVKTGRDLPDVIPHARHASVAWEPKSGGFYYTRYPAPGTVPAGEEEYHRHVFHHRLGADPATDRKVFGEGRAMTDSPSVQLSPDGRTLAIEVWQGWAKSELFLLDTRAKDAAPVPVVTGRDALFSVADMLNDRLFVLTNDGAPRWRLYAVDPRRPAREHWRSIIPEGDDILQAAFVAGGKLVATYMKDAASRVRLFSLEGQAAGELALPGLGTVAGTSGRPERRELFVGFTTFVVPKVVLRHDLRTGKTAEWKRLPVPVDAERFVVEQVRYRSKDGTAIPMFLVHQRGLARDGTAPAVLYGYGGFNLSVTPSFYPWAVPFIERGGVLAVACLRGGAEYGETWHRAGMLGEKQNVFDDFIAAAEHLVAQKITNRNKLAISGRSNGGLLVGAALTQRPDLFRAAISGVPLLDMIRYHKFRIARLWIPEYGSADDPEAFRWLYAYSPYHRVKDGTDYPATLFFTGEGDSRVDPLHARKMAARLQAATTGKKGPILLRLEGKAGHGQGKPVAKLVDQHADELAFLFQELGMR